MTSRRKFGTALQASIADVLLHDWDPIGIQDEAGAQDEYDDYVGGVYRLLVDGATETQLADHLFRIEADAMGIPRSDPSTLLPVAKKLFALEAGSRAS